MREKAPLFLTVLLQTFLSDEFSHTALENNLRKNVRENMREFEVCLSSSCLEPRFAYDKTGDAFSTLVYFSIFMYNDHYSGSTPVMCRGSSSPSRGQRSVLIHEAGTYEVIEVTCPW